MDFAALRRGRRFVAGFRNGVCHTSNARSPAKRIAPAIAGGTTTYLPSPAEVLRALNLPHSIGYLLKFYNILA